MQPICDDLRAEHADLDALVAGLAVEQWDAPTPAEGWSVRDQISHLWFFDQKATLALEDPDGFAEDALALMQTRDPTSLSVDPGRAIPPTDLLVGWRRDRDHLVDVARGVDPSRRVPWYGPPMGARSFITARLMETWAHGQDVADALGVRRQPTDRLRHVAHIGVRARPFSYAVRNRAMPDVDVVVELTGPAGDTWRWGDDPGEQRHNGSGPGAGVDAGGGDGTVEIVRGPALDFCLVVTQRRHVDDTALVVRGDAATEWMSIAQAFAGGPGIGRRPGQFAGRPAHAGTSGAAEATGDHDPPVDHVGGGA